MGGRREGQYINIGLDKIKWVSGKYFSYFSMKTFYA